MTSVVRSRAITPALIGATFWLVGCGGGDGLERQSVRGVVTVGGERLKMGRIVFDPDGPGGAVSAGSPIVNGSYAIPEAEGPTPGSYAVRISSEDTAPAPPDPNEPPGSMKGRPTTEPIPARYNTQTELKASVTKGGKNEFDFELEASKKKR